MKKKLDAVRTEAKKKLKSRTACTSYIKKYIYELEERREKKECRQCVAVGSTVSSIRVQ